ncbi:Fic family protein [Alloalcanivorax xenomutans]|uniref:Fic family protein n=1 Tax=Alloalcanivorax xenomutans TaxID=1094342 RepID=UPI0024E1D61C|nr:Fic family protein [Alloalcanivorax xenomutans]
MSQYIRNHTKADQILDVLWKLSAPASLPEILEHLPEGFAERSTRRWLSQLVEQGLVVKSGQKRGTRYRLAESTAAEIREPEPPVFFSFSDGARQTLERVRRPLLDRRPVSYNGDWLEEYKPNHSRYFSQADIDILTDKGRRTDTPEPAGTYARRVYNRLLIDLSYHSSRLEGNTYSLIETQRLLLEGTGATGKLDEEAVMILNHKEAIRYLVERAGHMEPSYEEICTLHYLLSDGLVPPPHSGKIRDHGVRVGASSYIPLDNPTTLERRLRGITAKAMAIQEPYEQSLFLLLHVAYLQAFTDVNKRTSRLAANIPLITRNRVPLSFNAIEKDDYASAMLAVYELNDPRPLIELYRASYLRGCQEYDATAEALGVDTIRVRYRAQRRDVLRQIILERLSGAALTTRLKEAARAVPENDRNAYFEDLEEDIRELSPQRLAGLGVTREDYQRWRDVQ